MPSYFNQFPKIYYDAVGNGNYKLVTNLLRRVQIKEGLRESAALFDLYNITGEETPESVAEQYYGDQKYYWIILLFNNIKDRFYDWPLSQEQFETYVNDKYTNINGVHHYEVTQDSGSTTSFDNSHKIQVNSTVAGATAVTNYDYELRLQQDKGRIKLIKSEFLDLIMEEFRTLIGA
jgi:DNA primase large subunit